MFEKIEWPGIFFWAAGKMRALGKVSLHCLFTMAL